jgi:FAD/FMN-containing dehydrogenase
MKTQVKAAAKAKVPFLAQGGRHGYGTTFDQLDDGLSIDLSNLNSVTVDKSKGTVTIGGGAKVSDVNNAVAAAGYQIGTPPSQAAVCLVPNAKLATCRLLTLEVI